MNIEGSILTELCNFFHFPIEEEIILFAFRGCLPENVSGESIEKFTAFKNSYCLKSIPVNYLTPRCTIGIWNRTSDQIALYPGSTLPSKDYVVRNPSCISTLNVLCPGSYRLRKGMHPRNENGFQPHKALLMDGLGLVGLPNVAINSAIGFNSRISNYNVIYPGDNLHAARTEPFPKFYSSLLGLRYSSSGCITIAGQPSEYLKYNHQNNGWNAWDSFINTVSDFIQDSFTFLLFNHNDLKMKSRKTIRYGSKQTEVGQIQHLLSHTISTYSGGFYFSGDIDCCFSGNTAHSYLKFCREYSSSRPSWEIDFQDFSDKTKHFNSILIQPENAIH
jgi:hypothetical protein